MAARPSNLGLIAQYALLGAVALLAFPFVRYALELGVEGFQGRPSHSARLHAPGAWASNAAIYAHMIGGAAATALAPPQVVGPIRRRWPRLHRATGYALAAAAGLSAAGGLAYIALRGTVGGVWMDLAFGTYGLLTATAAVQAVRLARAADLERHWRWGLRLFALALGSWLYRLHYALWALATDRLWMEDDFSGLFDRVNVVAFYAPYLLALEAWFRLGRPRAPLGAARA